MTMSRKILVVDDELHIVHIVALKFRQAGYEVLVAQDGQKAFELAQVERPDVIITDYQMPHLDGLQLARCVKQTPGLGEVPIILLTGQGFSLSPRAMEMAGIEQCVHKPFGPRELLRLVDALFEPLAV